MDAKSHLNPTAGTTFCPSIPTAAARLDGRSCNYTTHPRPRSLLNVIRTGPYVGLQKRAPTDKNKCLTLEQVIELVNAAAFANSIGWQLNGALTIRWKHSPHFTPDIWAVMQTELFNKTSAWLRRSGVQPVHVWIREKVRSEVAGEHTHAQLWLGSQPTRLAGELASYIRRVFEFTDEGVDISFGKFGMKTPKMRAGSMRYLLKGVDHAAFKYLPDGATFNIGSELGIGHRGTQGTILIKRAGVSENISKLARQRSGWTETRDVEGLRRLLSGEAGGHGQSV